MADQSPRDISHCDFTPAYLASYAALAVATAGLPIALLDGRADSARRAESRCLTSIICTPEGSGDLHAHAPCGPATMRSGQCRLY